MITERVLQLARLQTPRVGHDELPPFRVVLNAGRPYPPKES